MAFNSTCTSASDDVFGPAVHGCRDNFDFTLLFEQTILSIAPSALLLLCTPVRLVQLGKSSVKTLYTPILATKAVGVARRLSSYKQNPDVSRQLPWPCWGSKSPSLPSGPRMPPPGPQFQQQPYRFWMQLPSYLYPPPSMYALYAPPRCSTYTW